MIRKTMKLRKNISLLFWLVLIWCFLWGSFSLGNIVLGIFVAVLTTKLFYLPPISWGDRFNVWFAFILFMKFFIDLFVASYQVVVCVLKSLRGVKVSNAIVKVQLRTKSDIVLTGTVHCISLIPGSLVLEVDRSSSVLYLHVLQVSDEDSIVRARKQVLDTEASFIKILGSREELDILRAEEGVL